jgi:putative membrane protein
MVGGERAQHNGGEGDLRILRGLLLSYAAFWLWLAIDPVDRRDWFLENLLTVAFVTVLVVTHRRFAFSLTSYCLIGLFLIFHTVGAHYTYAEVPVGHWLKETLDLSRNPFDRIAHFAYGLLLVYPFRELLVRLAGVKGLWSYYLPASGILAQSGLFEVIEAIVAIIVSPELGSMYLGTQGDEWDAQKDMAAAFVGSLLTMACTLALFRRESINVIPA